MELNRLKLTLNVVSQMDVNRLIRELNSLEDFFVSASHRQAGTPLTPPRLSRSLNDLAKANALNLLDQPQRQLSINLLNEVLKHSPMLHISFASEPQPAFMDKIVSWMRTNIHPQTLLQVGLQPSIAAGCILRTPNRLFDMSLRSHLKQQEPYLVRLISGANRES